MLANNVENNSATYCLYIFRKLFFSATYRNFYSKMKKQSCLGLVFVLTQTGKYWVV